MHCKTKTGSGLCDVPYVKYLYKRMLSRDLKTENMVRTDESMRYAQFLQYFMTQLMPFAERFSFSSFPIQDLTEIFFFRRRRRERGLY